MCSNGKKTCQFLAPPLIDDPYIIIDRKRPSPGKTTLEGMIRKARILGVVSKESNTPLDERQGNHLLFEKFLCVLAILTGVFYE